MAVTVAAHSERSRLGDVDSQPPCAPKVLAVGAGALGGTIAALLRASGRAVWIATGDEQAATEPKATGLHVTGVGGEVSVDVAEIAPAGSWMPGRGPSPTTRYVMDRSEAHLRHDRWDASVLPGLSSLGSQWVGFLPCPAATPRRRRGGGRSSTLPRQRR